MELQTYRGDAQGGALVARDLSEEEEAARQQRIEEANKLEEKLTFINEKIPSRVMNIMGSNAGAGSGEFHMYRQARRREQMRLQRMEQDAMLQEQLAAHEAKKTQLQQQDELKTAKRRAKRQKRKEKKRAKPAEPGDGAQSQHVSAAGSDSDSDAEAPAQADLD